MSTRARPRRPALAEVSLEELDAVAGGYKTSRTEQYTWWGMPYQREIVTEHDPRTGQATKQTVTEPGNYWTNHHSTAHSTDESGRTTGTFSAGISTNVLGVDLRGDASMSYNVRTNADGSHAGAGYSFGAGVSAEGYGVKAEGHAGASVNYDYDASKGHASLYSDASVGGSVEHDQFRMSGSIDGHQRLSADLDAEGLRLGYDVNGAVKHEVKSDIPGYELDHSGETARLGWGASVHANGEGATGAAYVEGQALMGAVQGRAEGNLNYDLESRAVNADAGAHASVGAPDFLADENSPRYGVDASAHATYQDGVLRGELDANTPVGSFSADGYRDFQANEGDYSVRSASAIDERVDTSAGDGGSDGAAAPAEYVSEQPSAYADYVPEDSDYAPDASGETAYA